MTLVALAVMPVFCQAQTTEEQKALESFRNLVRRHVDSYKLNGREYVSKLDGGWVRERFTLDPASAKFDVEKTSSLVSPLVGTLTFTLTRRLSAFHKAEAEAAGDTTFVRQRTSFHKHSFAYQDHQWRPAVRRYKDIGSVLDDYFSCDEALLKKEKPSEEDIHGCLEEFDDK